MDGGRAASVTASRPLLVLARQPGGGGMHSAPPSIWALVR